MTPAVLTLMPHTGRITNCHETPDLAAAERLAAGDNRMVAVDLGTLPACPTCGTPRYMGEPVYAGCADCR